jgi:hypothetical protein
MIAVIWSLITGNPIARMLAKIGGLILGVLTMRALWKRDGRKEAEAEHKAEAAEAKGKTIEEVLRETVSDDPADDIRRRMRERAERKP